MIFSLDTELEDYTEKIEELNDGKTRTKILREYLNIKTNEDLADLRAVEWDKFWDFVDENKVRAIADFSDKGNGYRFSQALLPLMDRTFEASSLTLIHMLPFRKILGAIVAAGSFIMGINTTALIPSLGISVISIAAGSAAAGYGAYAAYTK